MGRCKLHGGASTGPTSEEGKARSVAAMTAGRAAWVERMRLAKTLGLIDRFPGGWPKGIPRRRDRLLAKALAVLAQCQRRVKEGAAADQSLTDQDSTS